MNTLIFRCLFACAMYYAAMPAALTAGDSTETPTKEIIIVNYDNLSSASMLELASYTSDIWASANNLRVTITEYSTTRDAEMTSKINADLVSSLVEKGIRKESITLEKAQNKGSLSYFSISIASDSSIQ